MSSAYVARAQEIVAALADTPLEELDALIVRYEDDPRKQVVQAVNRARRRRELELRERARVEGMYELQRELSGDGLVLGVDEVGRGALAGPLTVAAVALPNDPHIWGLNDSKQLSPSRRQTLAAKIARHALAIGMAHIDPASIDAVGMSVALRMAMSQAIEDSGVEADRVLIDGNPVHVHPRERALVKGDARIAAIAAASIVAKVARDEMMVGYDEEYPGYHLAECKGYGSRSHIKAIRERGLTPIHRVSFCGNFVEAPRLF